jgi:hypothetical protein
MRPVLISRDLGVRVGGLASLQLVLTRATLRVSSIHANARRRLRVILMMGPAIISRDHGVRTDGGAKAAPPVISVIKYAWRHVTVRLIRPVIPTMGRVITYQDRGAWTDGGVRVVLVVQAMCVTKRV